VEAIELDEFVEDVMVFLTTRVWEQLATGDDGVEQAAKVFGDLDADPTGIFSFFGPGRCLGLEVMVAGDQVIGDLHERGAQATIGARRKGPLGRST